MTMIGGNIVAYGGDSLDHDYNMAGQLDWLSAESYTHSNADWTVKLITSVVVKTVVITEAVTTIDNFSCIISQSGNLLYEF
jgi:hypothetical protein